MAEGTLWKELKGQNGGGGAVFETCIAWKVGVGEQGGRIFRVKEGEKEREAEVVIRREKKRVGNVIGGNHSSRYVEVGIPSRKCRILLKMRYRAPD